MGKSKDKGESMEDKLYNLQAQQLAANVANWAAQLEFQKERFRLLEMPQFQQGLQLEVDKLAWQKAQDTWERAFQEASITGTYNGQPTTQWLMDQARLTGSYNGERTLEGKLTDAQIKDMNDKMKLANDQFLSATTGYFNGQKTFDREKFESAQALEGWKFIATLSGPQNAFKQARAIGSMPGGMGQMMQAYAGQYMLPGSSTVGSGGAGGGNPAGQLNDMMMGAGGNAGSQPNMAAQYQPTQAAYGGAPGAPVPQASPIGAPFMGSAGGPPMSSAVVPQGMGYGAAGPAAYSNPAGSTPNFTNLPGQGIPPDQWNGDTLIARDAWETHNPQYILDGSPLGYRARTASDPAPGRPYYPEAFMYPDVKDNFITGQTYGQSQTASIPAGYVYTPPGMQAPVNSWNYSGTQSGEVQAFPPGVASPAGTADVSSNVPMNPSTVSGVVNQPYQYAGPPVAPQAGAGQALLPNQINARNYDTSFDYQRQLLWADFEDKGYDKGLAQEAFLKSLPRYGGVSKGSVAF